MSTDLLFRNLWNGKQHYCRGIALVIWWAQFIASLYARFAKAETD